MWRFQLYHASNEATATQRAQWLAELAIAVEQAQRIAWRLGVSEGDDAEAKSLYARLEAARSEIDSLRRGPWVGDRGELEPFWMQLLPWQPRRDGLCEDSDCEPA
jgi:hypothetical protein